MKKSIKLVALMGVLACGVVALNAKDNQKAKSDDNLNLVEETSNKVLKSKNVKKSSQNIQEEKALLSIRTGDNPGLRFKYVLSNSQISSSFTNQDDLTKLTYGILVTKAMEIDNIEELVKSANLENGKNIIDEKVVFNCVAENVLFDENQVNFAGVLVGFNSKDVYDTYFSTIGYVSDGTNTIYTSQYFASYSYAIEEYLTNSDKYNLTIDQKEELENIVSKYNISSSFDAKNYVAKEYNLILTNNNDEMIFETSKIDAKSIYGAFKFTPNDFNKDYSKLTLKFKAKFENIKNNQLNLFARLNNTNVGESVVYLSSNEIQSPGIEVTECEDNTYEITLNLINVFYNNLDNGVLNLDYLRIQFANDDVTTKAKMEILDFKMSKTSMNDMKIDPEITDLTNTIVAHGPTITKTKEEKYNSNYSILLTRTSSYPSVTLGINYENITDKTLVFYTKPVGEVKDGYIRLGMAFSKSSTKLGTQQTLYVPVTKNHAQTIGTCELVDNGWYKCEVSMESLIAKSGSFDANQVTDIRIQIADADTYSIYMDSMQFIAK